MGAVLSKSYGHTTKDLMFLADSVIVIIEIVSNLFARYFILSLRDTPFKAFMLRVGTCSIFFAACSLDDALSEQGKVRANERFTSRLKSSRSQAFALKCWFLFCQHHWCIISTVVDHLQELGDLNCHSSHVRSRVVVVVVDKWMDVYVNFYDEIVYVDFV